MSTHCRKFLDVSSAHVTQKTMEVLQNAAGNTLQGDYGVMFYTKDLKWVECIDLAPLISMAESEGAEYVYVDQDGPILNALPTYDW